MFIIRVYNTELFLLLILYEHVVGIAGASLRCSGDENSSMEHHQIVRRNLNSSLPADVNSATESSQKNMGESRVLKNGKAADSEAPAEKTSVKTFVQDESMFGSNIYDDMLGKDVDEALIDQIFSNDGVYLERGFEFDKNSNNTMKRSLEQSLKDSFIDESQNGCFTNLGNNYDDSLINNMNNDVRKSPLIDEGQRFKRTAHEETPAPPTERPSSIKKEIEKVYNDISENVRMLWKLREIECNSLKQPLNKRFVIYDKPDDQMDKSNGKRNVGNISIELDKKVEMPPEKVEHIERKTDEEILQVNVPLKPTN